MNGLNIKRLKALSATLRSPDTFSHELAFNISHWMGKGADGYTTPDNAYRSDCGTVCCIAGLVGLQDYANATLNPITDVSSYAFEEWIGNEGFNWVDDYAERVLGLDEASDHADRDLRADLFLPLSSLYGTAFYASIKKAELEDEFVSMITPAIAADVIDDLIKTGVVNWYPAIEAFGKKYPQHVEGITKENCRENSF